ncbi:M24 family metallopeptidase [Streptomyces sp. NPDC057540]|uniref:M24 family metallopeptidase n=1 Tax=Streptomyces sp. NPDC057540 TaxID=3346160 RepID=UPI0036AFBB9F
MGAPDRMDEKLRTLSLVEAQRRAEALFAEVEARGLVAPGVGEQEAGDRIRELAHEMFGTARHGHGRLVRSGPHALRPHEAGPSDRIIGGGDLAVVALGPVFGTYEVDFSRTLAVGDGPAGQRLCDDLARVFTAGRDAFRADRGITARQLYAEVERRAADAGWALGGRHAGRLVGDAPYESADGARAESYISPDNDLPLRRVDQAGWRCRWVLEVRLTDRRTGFGGLYGQLLDLM